VIRVLLVDDQELVRAGLRGILREAFGFRVVCECADGTEALAATQSHRPDVVLMDVRMPRLDGVAATRQLRQELPTVPVLALTTFDDDEALAGMLRAGAAGFVLKGVPALELHRAVKTVAEGGAWLDPAVTARVLEAYRASPPAAAAPPRELGLLTAREREVLALIGQGCTNGEIAGALYVSEGTVKTHINHLFAKLGLRDRAAAVVFAHEHKLRAL
jgi:DNA-binding NarL/FixJ family response regulator